MWAGCRRVVIKYCPHTSSLSLSSEPLPVRHHIAQIRAVSGDAYHSDWWLEWAELGDLARADLSACFSELSPRCCPSWHIAYIWSLPVYSGSDLQQGVKNMDKVEIRRRGGVIVAFFFFKYLFVLLLKMQQVCSGACPYHLLNSNWIRTFFMVAVW